MNLSFISFEFCARPNIFPTEEDDPEDKTLVPEDAKDDTYVFWPKDIEDDNFVFLAPSSQDVRFLKERE